MSDSVFAAAGEAALASLSVSPSVDATTSTTTPTETPATSADATAPPPTESTPPASSLFDFTSATDDAKVKWLENGQPTELTLKDLREQRLLHAGFTQKTQKLAKEREAFAKEQAEIPTLRKQNADFASFVKNPELVEAYLRQNFPQRYAAPPQVKPAAPTYQPGDLLTFEQVQQLMDQRFAQLQNLPQAIEQLPQAIQQWTQQQLQQHTEELQTRTESASYAAEIGKLFKELYTAHPALEDVEGFEDVTRWKVAQMAPSTIEETLDAFRAVARAQVDKLNKRYTTQATAAVVAKDNLSKKGTEPPGGTGVPPAVKTYNRKDSSIDWKTLAADAEVAIAKLGR